MISVQQVRKWYRKFKSGRENIVDESRSGRSISVADKTLETKVDVVILCDQKERLSDIMYQVNAAYGCVLNIITKKLKF